jgi:hypothetical protein
MNWYWVIDCDNSVDDPLVADEVELHGIDESILDSGIPLTDWNPEVTFYASSPKWDGEPDDVLQNALGAPVYSPRLQDALNLAGIEGIQYLPVRVCHADGVEVPGYALANIINLVACLDWEKAEYRRWKGRPGQVRSITHLVVKGDALRGYDIVRMKEFPVKILASQKFVDVFLRNRFTGYSFAQLTDIT